MADPTAVNWSVWIQGGVASLVFLYFRQWMAGNFREIKDSLNGKVSEATCLERSEKCSDAKCRKITKVDKATEEQWVVINHHGHKGLEGEGNNVVRT